MQAALRGSTRQRAMRAALACGPLAAALHAGVVLAAAPAGYDAWRTPISELGRAHMPHARLVNALAFGATGALLVVCSAGVQAALPKRLRGGVGAAALAASGLGFIGAGIYPIPAPEHLEASLLVAFASCGALALIARPLAEHARRPSLARASWGVACLIGAYPFVPPDLVPLSGALQRLAAAAGFLWIVAAAAILMRGPAAVTRAAPAPCRDTDPVPRGSPARRRRPAR